MAMLAAIATSMRFTPEPLCGPFEATLSLLGVELNEAAKCV